MWDFGKGTEMSHANYWVDVHLTTDWACLRFEALMGVHVYSPQTEHSWGLMRVHVYSPQTEHLWGFDARSCVLTTDWALVRFDACSCVLTTYWTLVRFEALMRIHVYSPQTEHSRGLMRVHVLLTTDWTLVRFEALMGVHVYSPQTEHSRDVWGPDGRSCVLTTGLSMREVWGPDGVFMCYSPQTEHAWGLRPWWGVHVYSPQTEHSWGLMRIHVYSPQTEHSWCLRPWWAFMCTHHRLSTREVWGPDGSSCDPLGPSCVYWSRRWYIRAIHTGSMSLWPWKPEQNKHKYIQYLLWGHDLNFFF